jgi:hypothetical protein
MDKLHCANCGATIPAKNVNIHSMMAVCEQCDTVFKFDETVVGAGKAKRAKIKTPGNFTVTEDEDGGLEISYLYREHYGSSEWAAVIFGFIGLIFSSSIVLATRGVMPPLLIFGGVALFCLWILVAYLLNRAHITINDDSVQYFETPIYGFSNRKFDREDLVRIYCKPVDANELNNADAYYSVVLVYDDGSERKLIHYAQRDIAVYIQQMLTRHLGMDAIAESPSSILHEDAGAAAEGAADTLDSAEDDFTLDALLMGDDGEVRSRNNQG